MLAFEKYHDLETGVRGSFYAVIHNYGNPYEN